MLVYLCLASTLRFSKRGEIISGDLTTPIPGTEELYMQSTGNFLKIWMIMVWTFVGLLCCLSIFGGVLIYRGGPNA